MDAGYLTLESTTGQVLGWPGDQGAITLRQLMSFTSGLAPENQCTYDSTVTLDECVTTISQTARIAAPGTEFDYGCVHLDVAGRMAEVVTGEPWNELFAREIRDPLGLPADIVYYANPIRMTNTGNPLLAGGLVPYSEVVIGKSPAPSLRYGLTAWLECSTPQTGCHQISSPGTPVTT